MKTRRGLVSIAVAATVGATLFFLLVHRWDMTPNGLEVDYQTYLDGYEVMAVVTRSSGARDFLRNGEITPRFFRDDVRSFQLLFHKQAALHRDDFHPVPGEPGRRRWTGGIPAPKSLGSVALLLDDGVEPEDLQVKINGLPTGFTGRSGELAHYRVQGEHFALSSLELILPASDYATDQAPLKRVYLFEKQPQSLFLREISLVRDFPRFRFIAPVLTWTGSGVIHDFVVGSGASVSTTEKHPREFVRIAPRDRIITLEYAGDISALHRRIQAADTPVRIVAILASVLAATGIAVILYLYWPDDPVSALRRRYNSLGPGDALALAIVTMLTLLQYGAPDGLYFLPVAILATLASWFHLRQGKRRVIPEPPPSAAWIGLIAIVALMVVVQLYRLGEVHMWADEAFSYMPARYIRETGEPVYPATGFAYYRAHTYHRIVAQFLEWFGTSPRSARLPNIVFNVGTVIVIYLFGRRESSFVGIVAALVWITTNYVVLFSRWVRMYPMFWFLFILSAYLFYRAVVERPRPLVRLAVRGVDFTFNPLYLIAFLAVFLLAVETHRLAIVFVWALLLFFLAEAIAGAERKRSVSALFLVAILLVLIGYSQQGTFNPLVAFFRQGPAWSRVVSPSIYIVAAPIYRNLAFWFVFPLAFGAGFSRSNRLVRYTGALCVAGILFVGLQYAQAARYWSMILPFFSLLVVLLIHLFVSSARLQRSVSFFVLTIVLVLPLSTHLSRFVQEVGEINRSYRDSPNLTSRTKNQFGRTLDYIKLFRREGDLLLATVHPAHILDAYDVQVNYTLEHGSGGESGPDRYRFGGGHIWSEELSSVKDRSSFIVLRHDDDLPLRTVPPTLTINRNLPYGDLYVPARKGND